MNSKITHTCIVLACMIACSGCSQFDSKRHNGIVAEYNGNSITLAEIQQLTQGLSPEDSARVAETYIQQWATNLIEYDKAKDTPDKEIERLVEDYRHSLYIDKYERHLITQRMPKLVADSLIEQFYNTHSQQLLLREAILHGVLVVVPNGAPNLDKLRKWMQDPQQEENIEGIEKFAYQYAVGYELFIDEWRSINQIIVRMPLGKDDLQQLLKQKKQIELQDSVNTYILQVTEFYQRGEKMPLDFATPDIEKIILTQRQVQFIKDERNNLYRQAIKEHKIKRYTE